MKNKRLLIKAASTVILIVSVLLIGLYVYGSKAEEQFPEFSSYNSKAEGAKALYVLTGQMGYDTSRYERPSRFLPENSVQIAFKPDINTFSEELEIKYLKNWLKKGNTLVLIEDSSNLKSLKLEKLDAIFDRDLNDDGSASVYSVAAGKIYYLDGTERFTNKGLKEITPAVEFIGILDITGNKKIIFNEYFHGKGIRGATFYDILGLNGILVSIQLLLALAIYLFYKSRRFGKPVIVFETVKRQENENIFALSGIYIKSKAYSLVLETYMKYVIRHISKFLGYTYIPEYKEFHKAVSTDSYLKKMNLAPVLDQCKNYIELNKKDGKRLFQLINTLEKTRREIK